MSSARTYEGDALELTASQVCESEFVEFVDEVRADAALERAEVVGRLALRVLHLMVWALIAGLGYVVGYTDGVPDGLMISVAHWVNVQ